jgi:hypothetical protein
MFLDAGGPKAAAEKLLLILGQPSSFTGAPTLEERMQAAEGIVWLCGDARCRPFVSSAEVVRLLMEVEGSEGGAPAAEYCLWGMVCSGGVLCGEVRSNWQHLWYQLHCHSALCVQHQAHPRLGTRIMHGVFCNSSVITLQAWHPYCGRFCEISGRGQLLSL